MLEKLQYSDTLAEWKEKINLLFDEFVITSEETDFAFMEELSNNLDVFIRGGKVRDGSVVETISNETLTIPDNSTTIVAIYKRTGDPAELRVYDSINLPDRDIIPVWVFESNNGSIVDFVDLRTPFNTSAGGGASSAEGVLMFDKLISESVHVQSTQNALSVGPIVDNNVEVIVDESSEWVIL